MAQMPRTDIVGLRANLRASLGELSNSGEIFSAGRVRLAAPSWLATPTVPDALKHLEVANETVPAGKHVSRRRLDNRTVDMLAGEFADGLERIPDRLHDELDTGAVRPLQQESAVKPRYSLQARKDGFARVPGVSFRILP